MNIDVETQLANAASTLEELAPPVSTSEILARVEGRSSAIADAAEVELDRPGRRGTARRPQVLVVAAVLVLLGAGGVVLATTSGDEAPTRLEAASQAVPGAADPDVGPLEAILEPEDAIVADFGPGWARTAEWTVETEFVGSSSCAAFDDLARIDDIGGVEAVWTNGTSQLSQRTASLGFGAQPYESTARLLPDACPTVAVGSLTLSTSALDGDYAIYELDMFPIPDQASDGTFGDFRPGSTAWVVTLRRANVISVLTIESNGDLTDLDFRALARLAEDQLAQAPVLADGPFFPEEPAAAIASQIVEGATLTFDPETCRNDGGVDAVDATWRLVEPVPTAWRADGDRTGELIISSSAAAKFVTEDGTTLELTTLPTAQECDLWE